jgi:SAM-dependent methyltransferase
VSDDTWTRLAREHGARACVSTALTEAEIDELTARQWAVIEPLIRAELREPVTILDFGAGAGRFTGRLAALSSDAWTVAFEPCVQLRAIIPPALGMWRSHCRDAAAAFRHYAGWFNIIFVAMVLGDPDLDLDATAKGLAVMLRRDGLLVLLDHMPDAEPPGRWWRFRPFSAYAALFAGHGVALRRAGEVDQNGNMVTICFGRRP